MTTTRTRDWIFSFGWGQTHPVTGAPLHRRFVRIRGTERAANAEMHERFGKKWCFQYPSEDEAGVARFGLEELNERDSLGLLAPVR